MYCRNALSQLNAIMRFVALLRRSLGDHILTLGVNATTHRYIERQKQSMFSSEHLSGTTSSVASSATSSRSASCTGTGTGSGIGTGTGTSIGVDLIRLVDQDATSSSFTQKHADESVMTLSDCVAICDVVDGSHFASMIEFGGGWTLGAPISEYVRHAITAERSIDAWARTVSVHWDGDALRHIANALRTIAPFIDVEATSRTLLDAADALVAIASEEDEDGDEDDDEGDGADTGDEDDDGEDDEDEDEDDEGHNDDEDEIDLSMETLRLRDELAFARKEVHWHETRDNARLNALAEYLDGHVLVPLAENGTVSRPSGVGKLFLSFCLQ